MENHRKITPTFRDDIQIKTYFELEKRVGKVIYFSYGEGHSYYAWMKKVTKVVPPDYAVYGMNLVQLRNQILHHRVYGTQHLVYKNGNRKVLQVGSEPLDQIRISNAQAAAREPTEQEMKDYMRVIRHKRIFGTEHERGKRL